MRVKLNGPVVSNTAAKVYRYFGFEVACPGDIRQALDAIPEGEALTVEINSGGGSVFAGFEMYTALRGAGCETIAEVQSLAGSAASTIAVGCRKVLMSPVAQMMIHDPALYTEGNIRAHEESLQALRSVRDSILNGYCERCGSKASREALGKLMRQETWLSAQRAIDLGLADGMLFAESDVADMVNAVSASLGALVGGVMPLPDVTELMARMSDEDRRKLGLPDADGVQGAEESVPAAEAADNTGDWQADARLALEKIRF